MTEMTPAQRAAAMTVEQRLHLDRVADRGFADRPSWAPAEAGGGALHDGAHAIAQADDAMAAFAESVATIKADKMLSPEGRADAVAKAARAALARVEKLTGIADRLDREHAQAAQKAALPSPFPDVATRFTVCASTWPHLADNALDNELLFLRATEEGDHLVAEVIAAMPSVMPGAIKPARLAELQAARLARHNPAGAQHVAQLNQARRDVAKVLDLATADLRAAATPVAEDIRITTSPTTRVVLDPAAE